MSARKSAVEAVHTGVLGLWLGVVLMTGDTAARVFPIVKGLDPTTPTYAAYTGEHWRIIAGQVANRVFLDSDVVRAVCALIALASLCILTASKKVRTGPLLARWLALALVLAATGYGLLILRPRMQENAHALWTAAAAGNMADANTSEAAFSADHPKATGAMALEAGALLLALLAAGLSWDRVDVISPDRKR